jgi:hypothetical protein
MNNMFPGVPHKIHIFIFNMLLDNYEVKLKENKLLRVMFHMKRQTCNISTSSELEKYTPIFYEKISVNYLSILIG